MTIELICAGPTAVEDKIDIFVDVIEKTVSLDRVFLIQGEALPVESIHLRKRSIYAWKFREMQLCAALELNEVFILNNVSSNALGKVAGVGTQSKGRI